MVYTSFAFLDSCVQTDLQCPDPERMNACVACEKLYICVGISHEEPEMEE
jgi:hypothetical protein